MHNRRRCHLARRTIHGPRPRPARRASSACSPRRARARESATRRRSSPAARAVVDEERAGCGTVGAPTIDSSSSPTGSSSASSASSAVRGRPPSSTRPGVIVHTNLGRASWPAAAIEAARAAAAEPLFLELDRASGRRGRRYREAEDHLVALTGAEDALVVNNNAAAVALAVGLAGRRGVAVARGELVEIGGGVRIPEIVRRAGARLVEVGTTNRTRVADFEEALAGGRAAVVLRVHPSNFVQSGFVESARPGRAGRARPSPRRDRRRRPRQRRAARHGGASASPTSRCRTSAWPPAPTSSRFSGDKLVGGPQAGLLVGRGDLVARLRRDPLARAMRPDKTTLAAVAATLALYRAGVRPARDPGLAGDRHAARRARSAGRQPRCRRREVCPWSALESTVGGGSLPGQTLPSWGVGIRARSPKRCLDALRLGDPPVVGPDRGRRRAARPADRRPRRTDGALGAGDRGGARGRGRTAGDRRRRHGRPHRPRQDDAAAGAHRHRRRPPARGAGAGHDDRRRATPTWRSTTGASSTSSTCPGTTGSSATCSSAPARSTPRCSSSPPTTGRAPRRSSTSSCSTRSGLARGGRGRDEGRPARRRRAARERDAGSRSARCSTGRDSPARRCCSSRPRPARGSTRCARRSSACATGCSPTAGRAHRHRGRPGRGSRSTAPSRSGVAAPSSPARSAAGRSRAEARLRVVPLGAEVRVRGLQVHGRDVAAADGGRVALNLAGIDGAALHRGQVLAADAAVEATDRLLVAAPSPDRPRRRRGMRRAAWPPTAAAAAAPPRDRRVRRDARRAATRSLRPARRRPASSRRCDSIGAIAAAAGDRFVLRRPVAAGAPSPAGWSSIRARRSARRAAVRRPSGWPRSPTAADPAATATDALLDLHGALPLDALAGRWAAMPAAPTVGPLVLVRDVLDDLAAAALVTVAAHHDAEPDSAGVPVAGCGPPSRSSCAAGSPRRPPDASGRRLGADRRPRGDRPARPRRRPRPRPGARGRPAAGPRCGDGPARGAPRRARRRPPFSEAVRASGCPAEGVRALETVRSHRPARRRPRLRGRPPTTGSPTLAAARWHASTPLTPGGAARRDRHEPQVRHGDPRGPRSARGASTDAGRARAGSAGGPRPEP